MKFEKKFLKDLKPAEYNPRKANQQQQKNLAESLKKFGVVEPIIVNVNQDRNNIIVGGHFRVRELIKLKHKEADCVIVDLSLEDEKELNIRLNANTGEWDWELLANDWDKQDLDDWGLDISSLENKEPKKNVDLSENFISRHILEIECESEAEQEILYNRFLGEKLKVKILSF